jgi:hypothetical protein
MCKQFNAVHMAARTALALPAPIAGRDAGVDAGDGDGCAEVVAQRGGAVNETVVESRTRSTRSPTRSSGCGRSTAARWRSNKGDAQLACAEVLAKANVTINDDV